MSFIYVTVFVTRNIATIAVFYALPVIQLVITYQTVSLASPPSSHSALHMSDVVGLAVADYWTVFGLVCCTWTLYYSLIAAVPACSFVFVIDRWWMWRETKTSATTTSSVRIPWELWGQVCVSHCVWCEQCKLQAISLKRGLHLPHALPVNPSTVLICFVLRVFISKQIFICVFWEFGSCSVIQWYLGFRSD